MVRDEISAIDDALEDTHAGLPKPPSIFRTVRRRGPPTPNDSKEYPVSRSFPDGSRRYPRMNSEPSDPGKAPFLFGIKTLKNWAVRTKDAAERAHLARKAYQQRNILAQAKQDLLSGNSPRARAKRQSSIQHHGKVGSAIFNPLDGAHEHSDDETYDAGPDGCWPEQKTARSETDDEAPLEEDFGDVQVQEEDEEVLESSPHILTPEMMRMLVSKAIPAMIRWSKWIRIYSLARDGDSFMTMIMKCKGHDMTLLVVRTADEAVFGGFAGKQWSSPQGNFGRSAFFGTGQSFLYSFDLDLDKDEEAKTTETVDTNQPVETKDAVAVDENLPPKLTVFNWTGSNRYFQVCDTVNSRIAMGGGGVEGSFGLCFTNDFMRGSTGPCDTFGNVCLMSKSLKNCSRSLSPTMSFGSHSGSVDSSMNHDKPTSCNFSIVDFEVYAFGSAW